MTELVHSQLEQYLTKKAGAIHCSAYLVHGQEMLVEQSADRLVDHLLGAADRDICCQVVAGLVENIPDVLEELNTFALLAGPKIVLFKDAKLFDARSGHQRLVDQIADAYDSGDQPRAAKGLLQLCGRLDIDLDEACQGNQGQASLRALNDALGSEAVQQLVDHCLDQQWRPKPTQDAVGELIQAIEKGFPENHCLIVAANSKVPKNLKLYKAVAKNGLVVDCHVPMGDRRADKNAQDTVLRQALDQQLQAAGKRLASGGLFETLCQLTGFDLRTFSLNLEKLIDYSGDRPQITAEDIDNVLRRTKSDPIFELTNALAERNKIQALFYLNTLLAAKWHPLQILSAMANQVRKLLVAKDFASGAGRQVWSAGMNYQQFQQTVMPLIQAYDGNIREMARQWQPQDQDGSKKEKAVAKKALDVALAPNPKSAYPVYQTMLKSEKYTQQELMAAMVFISRSDIRLKSTSQDPAVVIKKTVADICNGNPTYSRIDNSR